MGLGPIHCSVHKVRQRDEAADAVSENQHRAQRVEDADVGM